jgi:hypothetical protein
MNGLTYQYANRRYPSGGCFMSGSLRLLSFRIFGHLGKLNDSTGRYLNLIPLSNKPRWLEIQVHKIRALVYRNTKDKELFTNERDYLNQSALLKRKTDRWYGSTKNQTNSTRTFSQSTGWQHNFRHYPNIVTLNMTSLPDTKLHNIIIFTIVVVSLKIMRNIIKGKRNVRLSVQLQWKH